MSSLQKIGLTPGQKNFIDTALGIVGLGAGWLVSNAAGFTGTFHGLPESSLLSLLGLIIGYFVSDAITYVDTGTAPSAAVVSSQAVDVLKKLQATPGLTVAEQQAVAMALAIAQSKGTP